MKTKGNARPNIKAMLTSKEGNQQTCNGGTPPN
jgi:hypothetical protein